MTLFGRSDSDDQEKKSLNEIGWTQLSYNKFLIIKEAKKCN